MQFRFDEEANALSIAIRAGEVVRTIELTDMVYIDVDADGAPLGIEFVSADELSLSCGGCTLSSKVTSGETSFLQKCGNSSG
jgi:uncharacterized protein YuzE